MTETASAIRPLRGAVIAALKLSVASVGNRVFTVPVPQEQNTWPRLVIKGYSETPDNFFMRSGSRVTFQINGQAESLAGDGPREELYEEVFLAVDNTDLVLDDHLLLTGTLRRTGPDFQDPDLRKVQHFTATYEGVTRLA